ncbi:MAG: sigma-70 family RNA polymerase sigma factor [Rhodomicrobiaceae bacterium]
MSLSADRVHQSLIAYLPNLRAFAIALCRDTDRADDLVQETMLNAWKGIDSFKQGTNLRAWLFTILRNTYFSQCRKRRREVLDDPAVYIDRLSVPPAQQGSVDARDLANALAQLSEEQREALLLVAAEGFAYEEAAVICNCPIGTIKSRVNRARHQLAELLGVNTSAEFGPEPMTQAILVRGLDRR